MNLEVSDDQRSTLDGMLSSLPRGVVDTKLPSASKLAGLFYHPNPGCRVMALVVSAGFDAVGGRDAQAEKKLDRAIQVFTLVSDDATGRDHINSLKERLGGNVEDFLAGIHDKVAPYAQTRMKVSVPTVAAQSQGAMPRSIEDGEALPTERRTGNVKADAPPRPARTRPTPPPRREPEPEPAAPAAEEAPAPKAAAPAPAKKKDVGPSEEEAAAAAAAALAAIEAPYEEVVEDDAPPRFDPDRDLDPDEGKQRRRRRGRSLEGLERPRPDEVARQEQARAPAPAPTQAPRAERSAPARDDEAAPAQAKAEAPAPISVERGGDAASIAESGLEALKLALRRARESGLGGNLAVTVTITTGSESRPSGDGGTTEDGQRRRRRRRRGGSGRE
ncbi:MAG: hypothetical protein ACI9WU_004566 [Myxococcota bacterium]|jgi:hypothetical protein